jgi:hypothetical protein
VNGPAWLFLFAFAASAAAQTPAGGAQPAWTQQFGGYFKDLASGSRSYFDDQAWGDNLDRLRLSYDGKYRDWFAVHLDYDNDVHEGNWIGLPDFEVVRDRQSAAWLDLQHIFVDGRHVYWDTSLYRGYVSVRRGPATLTVGRQRIGWGTARFWSPMDMFNPISPLAIEADEREGVDAALLALRSPGDLRWNAVYAPQNGFRRSTSAIRVSRTIFNYDFDAAAARFGEDWTVGGDFAGQIGGAGLRGEMTYRWRHPEPGTIEISTHNALRATIGSDYAFANGLYLVAEYFYNQGQPDSRPGETADVNLLLQFSNEIFTLHRHFVSGGASYPLTPLWKIETYVVTDVAGPSVAVLPKISHSLTANTDLSFGAQLFASSPTGEFHGVSDLAYAELVIHFR